MALINCPECNHQVSDKALACPNCGCTLNQKRAEPVEQVDRYGEYVCAKKKHNDVYKKEKRKFSLFAPISFLVKIIFNGFITSFFLNQYNPVIELISSIVFSLIMCVIFYSSSKPEIKYKKIFITAIIPIPLVFFPNVITNIVRKYFYLPSMTLIYCNAIFTVISIILSYILTCVVINHILQEN